MRIDAFAKQSKNTGCPGQLPVTVIVENAIEMNKRSQDTLNGGKRSPIYKREGKPLPKMYAFVQK